MWGTSVVDVSEERIREGQYRSGFRAVYVWIPLILSVVVTIFVLILKFSEKVNDSFASWTWVFGIIGLAFLLSFGLSLIIYLVFSLRHKKPDAVEYNTREFCDREIRQEIRRRTGYNLSDFTDTGDSVEGNGFYGEHGQSLIYWHLYRLQKGQRRRYVLGMRNMERGKDLQILVQSPMNFLDVDAVVERYANRLTSSPQKYSSEENIFTDQVTGRQEIRRKRMPILDSKKDDEEEEEVGGTK
jgi:uncharacterized integral membrane protein